MVEKRRSWASSRSASEAERCTQIRQVWNGPGLQRTTSRSALVPRLGKCHSPRKTFEVTITGNDRMAHDMCTGIDDQLREFRGRRAGHVPVFHVVVHLTQNAVGLGGGFHEPAQGEHLVEVGVGLVGLVVEGGPWVLPRRELELVEIGELHRRDQPARAGDALEVAVMDADQVAVGCQPDVALEAPDWFCVPPWLPLPEVAAVATTPTPAIFPATVLPDGSVT